jgi:CheY-like chemotaxis protein
MDMQMPVMDGVDATRTIRSLSDPAKNSIPVVAVTANAFVDDVRTCLDAGMDAHVCKPVNVDSVIKALLAATRARAPKD